MFIMARVETAFPCAVNVNLHLRTGQHRLTAGNGKEAAKLARAGVHRRLHPRRRRDAPT